MSGLVRRVIGEPSPSEPECPEARRLIRSRLIFHESSLSSLIPWARLAR